MMFRLEKSPIAMSEDEALELGAKRVSLKEDEYSRFVIETVSNDELILFIEKAALKGYEVIVKPDYDHRWGNIPALELIPMRDIFV